MIESVWLLLRLAAGLGSIVVAGYALLVLVLPRHSRFTPLERLTFAFGLGSFGITMWMLLLNFGKIPYSLGTVAVPWLALGALAGWPAWKRGWLKEDGGTLLTGGYALLTLGSRSNFSRLEKGLLLLIGLAFGFSFLRATLYPIWAWDALSTWGLKAKAFYLGQGLDLSRVDIHNYYPNLVPLLMAYLYLWLGGVLDHLVKAVFPLWGGGLVLLYYCFLRRLGLKRVAALGAGAFLMLNGATFLTHCFIAYADLPLTYYQLGAAGLLFLWLRGEAPAGSEFLIAIMCGGMAWSKFEGWPLVLITFLAGGLALLWLRPPRLVTRLWHLILMGLGGWFLTIPWRLYVGMQGLEVGGDHVGGFYLQQFVHGGVLLLRALVWIPYFGLLWPAIFLGFILAGRALWRTSDIFLGLFVAGNLAALALAYGLVPASPAEFPFYVRATVDRLLLHMAPASALILYAPLASLGGSAKSPGEFV
jgi:hypothetical protein